LAFGKKPARSLPIKMHVIELWRVVGIYEEASEAIIFEFMSPVCERLEEKAFL
jgi:hypothetical protein